MKYLNMHGAQVPALGFGTWPLKGDECVQAMQAALEIGYRHIDTAQMYENEAEIGIAIENSGISRKELFVTTKLRNLTHAGVMGSTEESLAKLRMDYVDLLLIHWPQGVALTETLGAMQELMQKGKVKAIGVSNFGLALLKAAVETNIPIACNQMEYNVLVRLGDMMQYAQSQNMMITAYSPLAKGTLANHPVLTEIGKKYGKTASQVALRWLIEQPGVSTVPKAANQQSMRDNFTIFDFQLSDADRQIINTLTPEK